MKRVLITGANSYIGTSVEKWLLKDPKKYYIETLDVKDSSWDKFDFKGFDVVFHVAGIAHVSNNKKMEDLYYTVNRDLTIKVAKKAKKDGVKQFIFMSSMIVYSSKETEISKSTKPNPDNFYGKSKLEAEEGILKLEDDSFKVAVLRPPMIYGPNSKGNFPKLYKLALKTFIFPRLNNKRSILFIDNLSEFVAKTIAYNLSGIYFPQNREIISTSEIVVQINVISRRKVILTNLFNVLLRVLRKRVSMFNKLFSDLYYEEDMSAYDFEYQVISFNDSIHTLVNKNA